MYRSPAQNQAETCESAKNLLKPGHQGASATYQAPGSLERARRRGGLADSAVKGKVHFTFMSVTTRDNVVVRKPPASR
eukprot:g31117.t1